MTAKFPKITEAGLADLRSRIGVKIENTVEPWNYEATRDAIRHYAHGIGDDTGSGGLIMLLAIDCGNTNTVFAVCDGDDMRGE